MSTCVAFVFAALLEYAYVNTLSRQEEQFRRDVRDSNSKKQDTEVLEVREKYFYNEFCNLYHYFLTKHDIHLKILNQDMRI